MKTPIPQVIQLSRLKIWYEKPVVIRIHLSFKKSTLIILALIVYIFWSQVAHAQTPRRLVSGTVPSGIPLTNNDGKSIGVSPVAALSSYKDPFITILNKHNEQVAAEKARVAAIAREKALAEQKAEQDAASEQMAAVEPVNASQEWVKSRIVYWAGVYGVSSSWMLNIARCESTYGQDWAYEGHYGLYQYLPSTWAEYSADAGVSAPFSDMDAQAHVTAWALANGHAGAWQCA